MKPASSEKSEQATLRQRLATKTAGVDWTKAAASSHIAAFTRAMTFLMKRFVFFVGEEEEKKKKKRGR